MNDIPEIPDAGDSEMDRRLSDAGSELRASFDSTQLAAPASIDAHRSRRRSRVSLGIVPAAAAALVIAVAASAVTYGVTRDSSSDTKAQPATIPIGKGKPAAKVPDEMVAFLAKLPDQPVDPHTVKFTPTVSSFSSCDALIDRLRRVGAEHVGSQGFGAFNRFMPTAAMYSRDDSAARQVSAKAPSLASAGGETVGTNVQVAGVDELDEVKAVGKLIFTLRGERLRIADVSTRSVVSVTDLDIGDFKKRSASSEKLLVSGTHVIVFGRESVQSEPVKGDPSASISSTEYMTVTQIDIADPAHPKVGLRTRIEGHLVDARLVGDQVRMVTGSSMSDIGFVMPTTPNSVRIALESNRRTLAASAIADWIPEWDTGKDATPITDCDHVYLPDTFSGVSMTSMVNFTADGTFEPHATTILAPSDVIYATADKVAVSSNIWVDPADQGDNFDDWNSAVHTFDLSTSTPSYVASGQVAGTIGGQFNFGEVGDSLAVVASSGTPWGTNTEGNTASVNLTTFRTEGSRLVAAGEVKDIAPNATVSGVRFTATRAFVSNGFFSNGNRLSVIDLSNPAAPKLSASLDLGGTATYIHPVSDVQVVALGSRSFEIPNTDHWNATAAHADLVDTADAAAPKIIGAWDVPYSSTNAAYDHHALLPWASAKTIGMPVQLNSHNRDQLPLPAEAVFVSTDPGLAQRASVRPERVAAPAPCPTGNPADFRDELGKGYELYTVLNCGFDRVPDFAGYNCYHASRRGEEVEGVFLCQRNLTSDVVRVLVVDGSPWIYTTESLQSLDAATFASTGAIPIA